MASLRYLRKHVRNGYWYGPSIRRTPEIHERYQNHLHFVKTNYTSTFDFIKIHHFHHFPLRTSQNLIYGSPYKNSIPTEYGVMTENLFPYDICDDLTHRIFWSTKPRTFCSNNDDFVWFVNLDHNRSIPDLWHAHIFFKNKKEER